MPAVQIELSNLVQVQTTALSDAWAGTSWLELYTAFGDVVSTLITGTSMLLLIVLCLVVIYAVTYAQVIWAQMAILILTFVGPLMIPWLVFEPMAFLFLGCPDATGPRWPARGPRLDRPRQSLPLTPATFLPAGIDGDGSRVVGQDPNLGGCSRSTRHHVPFDERSGAERPVMSGS